MIISTTTIRCRRRRWRGARSSRRFETRCRGCASSENRRWCARFVTRRNETRSCARVCTSCIATSASRASPEETNRRDVLTVDASWAERFDASLDV